MHSLPRNSGQVDRLARGLGLQLRGDGAMARRSLGPARGTDNINQTAGRRADSGNIGKQCGCGRDRRRVSKQCMSGCVRLVGIYSCTGRI